MKQIARPLVSMLAVAAIGLFVAPTAATEEPDRLVGMLLGGAIGDAAGGPVEFVPPDQVATTAFRVWAPGERLLPSEFDAYGQALELLPYARFRSEPEPYAHWLHDAPPGTVTDDTRHKIIIIEMLERGPTDGEAFAERDLASAYIAHNARYRGATRELAREWLAEYLPAARWVMGDRGPRALPPSRLWGGMGTCAGQMALPPLAGVHPGDPDAAYRLTYGVAFIDNADGRDLNAAFVAALADAIGGGARDWDAFANAMRRTDPFRYREIPWVERSVDRWLSWAREAADRANGSPAALKATIEQRFPHAVWWEAHVTFAMAAAAIEFTDAHPSASMRLAIELGYDTDSTAQVVGMVMGALHGPEIFPPRMRRLVTESIAREGYEPIARWTEVINAARAGQVDGR